MNTTLPHAASSASSVALPQDHLPRRLGEWSAAVAVDLIIGSGIFRVPNSVAAEVGTIVAIAAL